MSWRTTRLTATTVLPVSLNDVKEHLNIAIADTTQDDKLTLLIYAAQERLEREIDRIILDGTFKMTGPCFGDSVLISHKPVTAVTAVKYIDTDGNEQTLDPSDWRFLSDRREVVPAIGGQFPSTYPNIPDAVSVEYSAGYGTEACNVPRMIRAAMMLCVGKWCYDPGQESSALHSQEQAYRNIVNNLFRETYP